MRVRLNENYKNVKDSYLFSEIAARVRAYSADHPEAKIIRLGIGDVTLPLPPVVVSAMQRAVLEMGSGSTFRGYPPEYGYDFLRNAVSGYYAAQGVNIPATDIFISDGAKSDIGNIVELFDDNPVYIPDPVYPVYVDTNTMSGRDVHFLAGNAGNGFLPMPGKIQCEGAIFYLCSPNNPTGAVYSAAQLREWVDFANATGSLILFDAAYEAFITGDAPHSIYAIPGAETCAVEICSFSKMAGFTGTRCAWTVVPKALTAADGTLLQHMWMRRQATKFNGVSYPVQRAAEAALSPEGLQQCRQNIRYYLNNAALLADLLTRKGIPFTGGSQSPYVWLQCPGGMDSWAFFDHLLEAAQIVGTPGAGFGEAGKNYFRLTAFGTREATEEAVARLERLL